MAKSSSDKFDAVRTVVQTLDPFDESDQEQIIRWACESIGLSSPAGAPSSASAPQPSTRPPTPSVHSAVAHTPANIKSFVNGKSPRSDIQFAATVAYYFEFEAAESERKDEINGDDLREACRLVDRGRLTAPGQTLINAHHQGLLDKGSGRGFYRINAVGENLVAMTLPETSAAGAASGTRRAVRKKTSRKKKAKKKTTKKKTTKKKHRKKTGR